MPDRITVILPPVLSDEERIAEALSYSSLTEGDGWGDGYGTDYGTGDGDGWGRGYGMHAGDGRSTDV